MPRKMSIEQDVLQILMDSADEGIPQSELWKKLKADSREGSRAILRLERKRLINRKKELYDGRWTYRVFAKRRYSTIDSIMGCPCAFCENGERCDQIATLSPAQCEKLTQWLLKISVSR